MPSISKPTLLSVCGPGIPAKKQYSRPSHCAGSATTYQAVAVVQARLDDKLQFAEHVHIIDRDRPDGR